MTIATGTTRSERKVSNRTIASAPPETPAASASFSNSDCRASLGTSGPPPVAEAAEAPEALAGSLDELARS